MKPEQEFTFLDTEVFEKASFNFKSTAFEALARHLRSGRVRLVTTDITIREVKSRIRKDVLSQVAAFNKAHRKSERDARVLRSSALPEIRAALDAELNAEPIIRDLTGAFDQFLGWTEAEVVEAMGQAAGPIFERFFGVRPPFGPSEEKKREFPDAFVAQALTEWATSKGTDLLVVTSDQLFSKACSECEKLHAKESLADLLDHVASDDDRAEFARREILKFRTDIEEDARRRFEEYTFLVAFAPGDVDVEVKTIELNGDPAVIALARDGAVLELEFFVKFDAHLSYTDASTGIWDSEEKELLFAERKETTVERQDFLTVEVEVEFTGMDPASFRPVSYKLVDPPSGYSIAPTGGLESRRRVVGVASLPPFL